MVHSAPLDKALAAETAAWAAASAVRNVHGDELCEIAGLGPIPVATPRGCSATRS